MVFNCNIYREAKKKSVTRTSKLLLFFCLKKKKKKLNVDLTFPARKEYSDKFGDEEDVGSYKGCRGGGALSNSDDIYGTCPNYLQKVEHFVEM